MEMQGQQWEYLRGKVGFLIATGFFLLVGPVVLLAFFSARPPGDASSYIIVGGGTARRASEGDVFWQYTLYPLLGFLFLGGVFTAVSALSYRWMKRHEPSAGRTTRFASLVVIIGCSIAVLNLARGAIAYSPPALAWAKMVIMLALFVGFWLLLVRRPLEGKTGRRNIVGRA